MLELRKQNCEGRDLIISSHKIKYVFCIPLDGAINFSLVCCGISCHFSIGSSWKKSELGFGKLGRL